MEPILEKPANPSRNLVFGLLMYCHSDECAEDCPLKKLDNNLTIEEKHEYTQGLSDKELEYILTQHENCYEKRLSDLNNW